MYLFSREDQNFWRRSCCHEVCSLHIRQPQKRWRLPESVTSHISVTSHYSALHDITSPLHSSHYLSCWQGRQSSVLHASIETSKHYKRQQVDLLLFVDLFVYDTYDSNHMGLKELILINCASPQRPVSDIPDLCGSQSLSYSDLLCWDSWGNWSWDPWDLQYCNLDTRQFWDLWESRSSDLCCSQYWYPEVLLWMDLLGRRIVDLCCSQYWYPEVLLWMDLLGRRIVGPCCSQYWYPEVLLWMDL